MRTSTLWIGGGILLSLALCLLCAGATIGVTAYMVGNTSKKIANDRAAKEARERLEKWNDAKEEALRKMEAAERTGNPAAIDAARRHMSKVFDQPP